MQNILRKPVAPEIAGAGAGEEMLFDWEPWAWKHSTTW
jgi:hypothetical protein